MKQHYNYQIFTPCESESLNRYFRDVKQYPMLSAIEEAKLAREAKNGDQRALEKLVCCNLRFVVSEAKKYQGRGVCLEDLISEGNFGLTIAALRFDETKGNKFITYAVHWIQKRILQALNEQGNTVRLPQNKVNDLNRVRKANGQLFNKLHRAPTLAELEEATGIPVKRLAKILWLDVTTESIDTEDNDTLWESLLSEESHDRADKYLMMQSLVSDIHCALDTLPEIESQVLSLVFGIETSHEHSLDEVGAILGIPHEKARQIRNKAMKHLRKSGSFNALEQYLAA
ncbi:MAG: sigma-70 family RNA polymerase sigma factor [Bacteroidales bacterium]|nr:sigma-70 family RNA polymerase sigma factor [Bacteroidales bacterium]